MPSANVDVCDDPPMADGPGLFVRAAFAAGCLLVPAVCGELWIPHDDPPPLDPLLAVGWLPLVLLVAGAFAVLHRPKVGAALGTAGACFGVLGDRLRLQPELIWLVVVGITILLGHRWAASAATSVVVVTAAAWAVASTAAGPRFGRVGLVPGRAIPIDRPTVVGVAVVAALLVGGQLWSRTRSRAIVGLAALVAVLGALVVGERPSWTVWGFSAGLVLLDQRRESFDGRRVGAAMAVGVVGLSLAGAIGVLDPGSSMQLYTTIATRAEVCSPAGTCRPAGLEERDTFGVYLPATRSVFVRRFRATCDGGQTLVVSEPAWPDRRRLSVWPCP